MEQTFDPLNFILELTSKKWAGGGSVAALAYLTFLFWNTWRKSKIEEMQIRIDERQKQEQQDSNDFKTNMEAKDGIIADLRKNLDNVEIYWKGKLAEAFSELEFLRKTFNSDRNDWAREKKAFIEQRDALLINNQGLLADNIALRHQNELLTAENNALKAKQAS